MNDEVIENSIMQIMTYLNDMKSIVYSMGTYPDSEKKKNTKMEIPESYSSSASTSAQKNSSG